MQATRTYVQLTDARQFRPAFGDYRTFDVRHIPNPGAELYRECYRTVGKDYHWRDRWDWTDDEIARHLATPGITLHVAQLDGRFVGWYELRRVVEDDSVEIAYFGLAVQFIGRGFGGDLLSRTIASAWDWGARRVWVHTCTLDHPSALANYQSRGLVIYDDQTHTQDR